MGIMRVLYRNNGQTHTHADTHTHTHRKERRGGEWEEEITMEDDVNLRVVVLCVTKE